MPHAKAGSSSVAEVILTETAADAAREITMESIFRAESEYRGLWEGFSMSRMVRFHQYGGPEQLRIEDLEVAAPGKGEVRIRVEAIGLNRSEALFRAGTYCRRRSCRR